MSMFRRRLISSLSKKIDYLEGRRISQAPGASTYRLGVQWLTDDLVRIYHTQSGFMGPNKAGKLFINDVNAHSSSLGVAMSNIKTPLPYIETGKTYRLTMELIEVTKNTATVDNDGVFTVGFGKGSNYSSKSLNLSEMVVGAKFEISRIYVNSNSYPGGAGFEPTNPDLLWDFTFKVKVEEVK